MVAPTATGLKPARFAGYSPPMRYGPYALGAAAVLSVGLWLAVEAYVGGFTHPASLQMQRASQTMQAAIQVVRSEKERRGLMQAIEIDPNRTGLIGAEYSDITTSMGMLDAKRTATNPDLAAALVRAIADLKPNVNGTVVILVSGSLVGADIAAIAATEALGLPTMLLSSVGASMFGATDPQMTWLDIEHLLRERGVITSRSSVAVIGGGGAVGSGLSNEGRDMIRQSAARNGVPIVETESVAELIGKLQVFMSDAKEPMSLLINAGGSVAALGTCINGDLLPAGLIRQAFPCNDGTPGLIVEALADGVPVLHLLNMRSLAAAWGLPYDPIPLPIPGNNKLVYGSPPSREPQQSTGK